MGKRSYRKSYKKKSSQKLTKKEKELLLTGAFILFIFVLLWVLFWLGIIFLIIFIFKWTHQINNSLGLYNTKYYYGAVITFLISSVIILFGGTQIAYNMGKINNTFLGWAVESSDYLRFGKSNGKTTIEANPEGMLQKAIIEGLTSTGNNLK